MDQRCDEEGRIGDEIAQHQMLDRAAEDKAVGLACKVAQKHEGRWTHTAARWQPEAVRRKGRPRQRWHDDINAYLTLATGEKDTCDGWVETLTDANFGREHREQFTDGGADCEAED